ncbi:hypothetical protein BST25_20260 [Mycobacterium heidelbergense]|uniref:Uncharacterized protein n=1 Tax=Mycobacterium heidelbergense TaxID=53376 RepID=A0A1X0DCD5_MYCHE|nr:hypothetical protein [Mycobacterium heidelbergense]ORA69988.1 hypothetical protein BST25_20260 [Mycobacterium heidelbergense]BBZ52164.1 hypothetical protein MHEI_38810 [Mycobacterium heidelbergense]
MQQLTALRPLVSAGAAAVGASLIALTPAVSNDIAADLQHSAVTIEQRAVELASTDYAVNPLQTWLDVFTNAAANLQTIGADWAQIPAVLTQQVAANLIQYANLYVGSYQSAANGALTFYTSTVTNNGVPTHFWPLVASGLADFQSGQIASGIDQVGFALLQGPIQEVLQPMENTLQIPIYFTQNIANATDALLNTNNGGVIESVGAYALFGFSGALETSLGDSLQAAYDAFGAGDPVDGVLNLLNTPGAVANGVINGSHNAQGLLSPENGVLQSGLLSIFANLAPQNLAKAIVVPGGTNVTNGGSLATAWGSFLNMAAGGWPSPNEIVNNILNVFRTYAGLPGLASAANAGSAANVAAAAAISPVASALPGLSVGVVKGFDPAAVTNIAASLGPSLAAEVAGSLGANLAGSLATTLSVDLSRVALHILSAL